MFDWITKRKERKEAKRREAAERYKAQQKAADDLIARHKAEMLEKPCPVNDGEKCSDKCVHFSNGYAFYMPSLHLNMPGYLHKEWPKCRLWCSR